MVTHAISLQKELLEVLNSASMKRVNGGSLSKLRATSSITLGDRRKLIFYEYSGFSLDVDVRNSP